MAARAQTPRHNIPEPIALFGRDHDATSVSALLVEHRLVTITGAPGVGKSVLARTVAAKTAPRFAGGAVWVEVAGVDQSEALLSAVAAAFRTGRSRTPTADRLMTFLTGRDALIVLDGCEHLIDEVASLVAELLHLSDSLAVLVTSREPLLIVPERVWSLRALGLPEVSPAPSARELRSAPATCLYLTRLREADPGFSLRRATVADIAAICRRLDGHPLAIELAAARATALAPSQVLAGLEKGLNFLDGVPAGSDEVGPLRAAIDESHAGLGHRERSLLRRLSVFAGGFTLESAAEVCAGPGLQPDDVLDVLGRLVTVSLVEFEPGPTGDRYRLLECVRAYAAESLHAAGEADKVSERHAEWCMSVAEEIDGQIYGAVPAAVARLETEHANVCASLEWLTRRRRAHRAVRLAAAMTTFWAVTGRLEEGRRWLDRVLGRPAGKATHKRAKAFWGAGFLAILAGDHSQGRVLVANGLDLAERSDNPSIRARALMTLAACAATSPDEGPQAAVTLLEESVTLAGPVGDGWCLAGALTAMAAVRRAQRNGVPVADGPGDLLQRALDGIRSVAESDSQEPGSSLVAVGIRAMRDGDLSTADMALVAASGLASRLGNLDQAWNALLWLGRVAIRRNDFERAKELFDGLRGLGAGAGSGHRRHVAAALCELGELARREGDVFGARSNLTASLSVASESGAPASGSLLVLGRLAAASGDTAAAEDLFRGALSGSGGAGNGQVLLDDNAIAALEELAALARTGKDLRAAAETQLRAVEAWSKLGDRAGIVRSAGSLAELLVTAEHPEAASALEKVLPSGDEDFDIDRVVSEAATGVETMPRPTTGWESLTRAEREVSLLVAENLTNREIGERLYISHRTVQTHLAHVFAKLGISSRREVAREVIRRAKEESEVAS